MHRGALGATLWILSVAVLIVGMVVAQIGYGSSYSLTQNHISDLGAVHCGILSNTTGQNGILYGGAVCSPWHDAFNLSIIVDGILTILGVLLVRTSFPSGNKRTIGLGLFLAAGVGSVGVGLFPEDMNLLAHSLSALLIFIAGNIGIIILGITMFRDPRWTRYRIYSVLSGLVGLVAFVLFVLMLNGPLGTGGMERLIIAPLLVWAVVVSVHLIHSEKTKLRTSGPSSVR